MSGEIGYTAVIDNLKKISASLDYLYLEEIHLIEDMMTDNKYKVAVVGEFSVGKSTFLNSLVGKRLLYSSAKEATGVVTFIENDISKVAEVLYEDESVYEVDLGVEDSYQELVDFMDKNNQGKKVKAINIKYPFEGVDKEVIFLDTPGLQGISMEQTLITKNILKEANATIIVINHKGLTKTELDLLAGRNKDFGRINTKEVFVVINRIGEIYENKTAEEAEEKILQLKREVEEELKNNGVEVNKVFAVDSKDYLWSRDDSLYNKVVNSTDNDLKGILTQEEYLKRSRFEEFQEFLFNFLEGSNRRELFLQDVRDKLLALIQVYRDEIESKWENSNANLNSNIDSIRMQKELMINNQRRLYNTMIRQLSKSSEELYKAVESDFKNIKENQMKEVSVDISKIKRAIHLNEKSKTVLHNKVQGFIMEEVENTNSKLNRYYSYINEILQNSFEKEFKRLFNEESNLRLKSNTQSVNIDFTFKAQEEENYDILDTLRDELIRTKREKYELEEIYLKLIEENSEELSLSLEQEIKRFRMIYEQEKIKIGRKPRPTQKYKFVKRSKLKCLVFKEDYEVKVPDGLDYTACEVWEIRRKKLTEYYKGKEQELFNRLEEVNYNRKKLKRIYFELMELDKNLNSLESQYKISQMKMEEAQKRNEEYFVNAKRNELYICIEKMLTNYYKVLLHHVLTVIEDREKKIKKSINDDSSEYLKNYEEKLNANIKGIMTRLDSVKVDDREVLNSLYEVEKELLGR